MASKIAETVKTLRFSQIALILALPAGLAYYAAFLLLMVNGIGIGTTISEALSVASEHPGIFGLAYLLQGLSFLVWALIPVAFARKFQEYAPGVAPLVTLAGGFGFVWRALSDLAKAGSMEYLGQVYAMGDLNDRIFVAHFANWTQLWTFGALWEFLSNGLALGIFPLLAGLLFAVAQQDAQDWRPKLGWGITIGGGVVTLSLLGTTFFYVTGVANIISRLTALPSALVLGLAPVVLGGLAWLSDREAKSPNQPEVSQLGTRPLTAPATRRIPTPPQAKVSSNGGPETTTTKPEEAAVTSDLSAETGQA